VLAQVHCVPQGRCHLPHCQCCQHRRQGDLQIPLCVQALKFYRLHERQMEQSPSCLCSSMQVTRDKLLREHMYCEKVDISSETGSGYPGGMLRLLQGCDPTCVHITKRSPHSLFQRCVVADPETKAWLQKHVDPVFGFPNLVRFSWSTCARILETSAVAIQWCARLRCLLSQHCIYTFCLLEVPRCLRRSAMAL
jgi:hypothetical protein